LRTLLFRGGVVSRNEPIAFAVIHHEGKHEEEDCENYYRYFHKITSTLNIFPKTLEIHS
jgi:hypothetical protein